LLTGDGEMLISKSDNGFEKSLLGPSDRTLNSDIYSHAYLAFLELYDQENCYISPNNNHWFAVHVMRKAAQLADFTINSDDYKALLNQILNEERDLIRNPRPNLHSDKMA
jgi:hypothetical protein